MPSLKILIADHEPVKASLVAGILKQNGYETRTEQSSSAALQNAAIFRPSLLVINPVMPGLSGVEVATRISTQTECKVLFLTTLASDNDFRELVRGLRQQGCDCEALPKPFAKEQLLEHVRRRIGTATIVTNASEPMETDRASSQAKQSSSGSTHTTLRQALGDYEPLLKLSTLQLYQSNAFRITGLDVDSSLRDISRETEKLEMMIELGAVHPSEGIFPLPDEASIHAVKSALQSLKDPEQRLLHEFFWFWPCMGPSKNDPAIQTLREKKYQTAVNLWTNTKGQGSGIAIHNLAVYYHMGALDSVIKRSKARTAASIEDQHLWVSSYRYWKALSEHSDFWDSLCRRIRDINDPRLKIDTAQRIWSSLPNAILRINAHLAIEAAENGDFEQSGKQRRLMYTSAFGEDCAKKEVLRGLGPLRDEVERLCDSAEAEARSNPRAAVAVVRKFLTEKARLLQTFNYLVGVGDPICDAVHDRVAEAGRVCLVAYVNETNDWTTAHLLFEECLALAEGKALRSQLEEDLEIIAGNIAAGRQSQSAPSTNASTPGASNKTASTSTPAPQSVRSPAKRTTWITQKVVGALAVGIILLFALVKGHEDSPPPSAHSSQTSRSMSYPQSMVPGAEPTPATGTARSTQSYPPLGGSPESQKLKAQIEADRLTLNYLEAQLNQSRSTLHDLETRLRLDKATLTRMKRDHNLGLEVDVDEYERIRRRYNNNVEVYNVQVNEYNKHLAKYKQLLASANAKIDRYNSLGRSR